MNDQTTKMRFLMLRQKRSRSKKLTEMVPSG